MSDIYFTFISIFPAHKSQNYDLVMRGRVRSLAVCVRVGCFTMLLCDCPSFSLSFGLYLLCAKMTIDTFSLCEHTFSSVQFTSTIGIECS